MPAAQKKTSRSSGARDLVDTGRDKRYVKRTASGRFRESDDVGKSSASDQRTKAKTKVKAGRGDRGDRR